MTTILDRKIISFSPTKIETPLEDIFYFEIWRIQIADLLSTSPKIIVSWGRDELEICYSSKDLDSFKYELNYLLKSISED